MHPSIISLALIVLLSASASAYRDPFRLIRAETYNVNNGCRKLPHKLNNTTHFVTYIQPGDVLGYKNLSFSRQPIAVQLYMSSATINNPTRRILLRLDSATSDPFLTHKVESTGYWDNWMTVTLLIPYNHRPQGVHDLYFTFDSHLPTDNVVNLDWFTFVVNEDVKPSRLTASTALDYSTKDLDFIPVAVSCKGNSSLIIKSNDSRFATHSKCINSQDQVDLHLKLDDGTCKKPEKLSPCNPNPCLYGGKCKITDDLKDYYCFGCPYPMGGKSCKDLDCNESCFRVNDTVIFVHDQPTKTWTEAHAECADKNMTLAMIQGEGTHELIILGLVDLYFKRFDDHTAFWVGINITSPHNLWVYSTAVPLNRYKPSASPPKNQSDYCLSLRFNSQYGLEYLYKEECTRQSTYIYFPLCQKNYPFLLHSQKPQLNPCHPIRGSDGDSCPYPKHINDYRCPNCIQPMARKGCADWNLENPCIRSEDTVYYIYKTKRSSWIDDYHKCDSLNMTMVTIKDPKTYRFLLVNLLAAHLNPLLTVGLTYIGINRTSNASPFTWIDGSPAGPFLEWEKGSTLNSSCATLNIRASSKIYEIDCKESNYHATVCQKKYPNLLSDDE